MALGIIRLRKTTLEPLDATSERARRQEHAEGAPLHAEYGPLVRPTADYGRPRRGLSRECQVGGVGSSVIPDAEAQIAAMVKETTAGVAAASSVWSPVSFYVPVKRHGADGWSGMAAWLVPPPAEADVRT